MPMSYNPLLMALSVLVAGFGAFTCFELAGRLATAIGVWRRVLLAASAVAMGGGIWSMHFIGMLAMRQPFPVGYDGLLTLISALVAMLITGVALYFAGIGARTPGRLAGAGLFMGLGIASMHYLGMAAIRADAIVEYSPAVVAASVVVAVLASTGALWLVFTVRLPRHKASGAAVMAVAVSGMHYTGMAAARFIPLAEPAGTVAPTVGPSLLAMIVAVATFLIFGLALLFAIPERGAPISARKAPAGPGGAGPRLLKVPVSKNKQTMFLDPDDVVSIKAEAHYCTVHTAAGAFFCGLSIAALEERLDPGLFVRVHRSHIVNMRHAKAFERQNEQAIIVVGDAAERRIPVSRAKVGRLRGALGV